MKSVAIALMLLAPVFAAAQISVTMPLDPWNFPRLKNFSAYRVSSNNRYVRSNDDSKRIMPGETLLLADLTGPGIVTHIWLTVADNEYAWPRLLRLRIYYNGHKTPSVDAPIGDFFAIGHGYERNVNSLMVRNSSFGRARNSYWPMPFRKSCKITVTNEGHRFVTSFYYHVDWQKHASLPEDIGYLHAYYRQETPPRAGKNYEFLNIQGSGQYVGTVMNVIQTEVGWFGEGDDLFYIDGERTPRIEGTGSEDYFNDAWALRESEGAWTGIPVAEGEGVGARLTGYRWHLPDPIPFTRSIRAEIEHYGWTYNSDGTARSGFEERADYFSSVAFWYQKGVNEGLPEPPYGDARLPHGNAQQIEVENLLKEVTAEKGEVSIQKEVFWSKDLLFFKAQGPGAKVHIPVDVVEDGLYEVIAQIAQAPDYGDYVATLDGKLTGSKTQTWAASDVPAPEAEVIRNYSPEVYVAPDQRLGWFELSRGRHTLTFNCEGKDAKSSGYNLGIDAVVLARVRTPIKAPKEVLPESGGPRKAQTRAGGSVYRGRPLSSYLAELKNAPENLQPELLRALGAFGPEAVPALSALKAGLSSHEPMTRAAAAWALSQVGPKASAAAPALAKSLEDSDSQVRGLAAIALREIGPGAEVAVPALIRAINDPVDAVRAPAADALGSIGAAASVGTPALSARLLVQGEKVFVLRSVAAALGNIGPGARDALPALRETLKKLRVVYTAEEAILKIENKPVPRWH